MIDNADTDNILTAGLLLYKDLNIEVQIHAYSTTRGDVTTNAYRVKTIVEYKHGGIDTWDEFNQQMIKTTSQIRWQAGIFTTKEHAEQAVSKLCNVYSATNHYSNRN